MGLPCEMAVAKYLIESRRSFLIPQSEAAWVLFALAVVWFALFFRLGNLPLLQPDEGRNAEVAREMKESGAWLSPSYDGIAYLDKPAFYFKAVALSLAAFGDNETAARLPSAIFGLALLAITFAFCRRVYGTRCAVMAVIIIATMPLYVVFSRTIIFDMTLAFFVSAAIFAGYRAEECDGKSRRNLVSARRAGGGFRDAGERAGGFSDSWPRAVCFSSRRRPARRLETIFCAVESAGVLRRDAAVVHRAFAATSRFSLLRTHRRIVSPVHDHDLSSFAAVLFLRADCRRTVPAVEFYFARSRRGGVEK